MGGTGERDDLGLMNAWTVRHLLTQAAVDETVVRAQGLISGGWRITALSSSTKNIIPTYEAAPSYAGFGPVQEGLVFLYQRRQVFWLRCACVGAIAVVRGLRDQP